MGADVSGFTINDLALIAYEGVADNNLGALGVTGLLGTDAVSNSLVFTPQTGAPFTITQDGTIQVGDTLIEGNAVSYDITVTPNGGTYYFGSKTVQLTLTVGKSQISYYDVARTYGDAESTQTPRWDKGAPSGLTYGISPQTTGISIDPDDGRVIVASDAPLAATGTYTVTATRGGSAYTTQDIDIVVYGMVLPADAALAYDNILMKLAPAHQKPRSGAAVPVLPWTTALSPWAAGNMPAGISINSADGTITVASTAAVQPDTVYQVTAEGTGNWRGRRRAELQINVYRGNSLYYEFEPALVGQPYTLSHVNTTLTSASPANWEYFSSSPAMPDGLTLDSSSGEISGTPTKRQLAKEYTISAKRGGFWGSTHTTKVRLLIREKATNGTLEAMVNEEITAQGNNADLGLIDTSDVTSMSSLFNGEADFNGDISSWDVGNVTAMDYMFFLATSFNGDLSGWDVGSVTNMRYMFFGASAFNGDLPDWNVGKVTNMEYMFYNTPLFNRGPLEMECG